MVGDLNGLAPSSNKHKIYKIIREEQNKLEKSLIEIRKNLKYVKGTRQAEKSRDHYLEIYIINSKR